MSARKISSIPAAAIIKLLQSAPNSQNIFCASFSKDPSSAFLIFSMNTELPIRQSDRQSQFGWHSFSPLRVMWRTEIIKDFRVRLHLARPLASRSALRNDSTNFSSSYANMRAVLPSSCMPTSYPFSSEPITLSIASIPFC